MSYAELQVTTNFSFLRGASHAHELAGQAAAVGHHAIAVTDRNTLAGAVRLHQAAKQAGLRPVIGARLDFTDAVVRWPEVEVNADIQHSSVVMIVPQGWSVSIDDVELSHGSSKNRTTAPAPNGVHLHVSGRAKHSSFVVRHPRKRHWWWPWYRK